MTNKKTVADKYREAIESMDNSVDTDIESQRHTRRQRKLDYWDEDQAKTIAEEQGIKLSEAHFKVIHALRDHYLENGLAESGRELEEVLANEFSSQGGSKYLRKLFPDGPVTQGMRIAGLPVPAYSEHDGFGTAY
ncbi:MAG: TusE/DsrC/DsvC family sulfur relay protein [Gammaproteobacteria bacterium]|nr:TusE/DsrC/DsvC family sulfur relay protein [Gammaproteobacteria bacterium]